MWGHWEGHLQVKERILRRKQPCWHLDLLLPASRTGRKCISVVESPSLIFYRLRQCPSVSGFSHWASCVQGPSTLWWVSVLYYRLLGCIFDLYLLFCMYIIFHNKRVNQKRMTWLGQGKKILLSLDLHTNPIKKTWKTLFLFSKQFYWNIIHIPYNSLIKVEEFNGF